MHRDQVARVLDQRREPRLAGAPVDLGRELGAAQGERDLVRERAQRVPRLVVVGGLAREDQHQAGARRARGPKLEQQDGVVAGGQAELRACVGRELQHAGTTPESCRSAEVSAEIAQSVRAPCSSSAIARS